MQGDPKHDALGGGAHVVVRLIFPDAKINKDHLMSADAVTSRTPDDTGEDTTWIPCDTCDSMVRFCDYAQHARDCAQDADAYGYSLVNAGWLVGAVTGPETTGRGTGIEGDGGRRQGAEAGRQSDPDWSEDDDDDDDDDGEPRDGATENMLTAIRGVIGAHHRIPFDAINISMGTITIPANQYDSSYESNLLLAEVMGGAVTRGVADYAVVVEPCTSFEADTCCPICCELLQESPKVVRLKTCRHLFCDACVVQWLSKNTKCPICMGDVEHDRVDNPKEGGRVT